MPENERKPAVNDDIQTLINSARNSMEVEQPGTATKSNPANKHAPNKILIAAFFVMLVIAGSQYNRILEPFSVPDMTNSTSAMDANIDILSNHIEIFNINENQYPSSLMQIRADIPESLHAMLEDPNLVYSQNETGFTLTWDAPLWTTTYESDTGETNHLFK